MLTRLWIFGFWLWFTLRGPYLAAKVYRWLFERSFRGALPVYQDIGALEDTLGQLKWKSDGLYGLLDFISKPERVQFIIDEQARFVDREAPMLARQHGDMAAARAEAALTYFTKVKYFDCDEFAIYAANTLGPDRYPRFVSINWRDVAGKAHGHNICVFNHQGKFVHISNWHGCKARFGFGSIFEAVSDVVAGGKLIGYAVATPQLTLIYLSKE